MRYFVELAGRTFTIEIEGGSVRVGGRRLSAALEGRVASAVRRLVAGQTAREFVGSTEGGGRWRLVMEGHRLEADVLDGRGRAAGAASRGSSRHHAGGTLRAPMPGRVVRLLAEAGQQVAAGQGLVVVEAMKMENELKAPRDGSIGKVHVAPGDRVEKGAPLLDLT